MNHQLIAIDKIFPNDWNPNHIKKGTYDKLKRFIQDEGSALPIVVRPHPSKRGCYEIIDGFHRWKIYQELGQTEVDAVVLEIDDDKARLLTINLNYMRGQAKPLEYAKLIFQLSEQHTLESLELLLPESKPQLLDKLELLKLPDDTKRELESKTAGQEKESLTTISSQVTEEQKAVIDAALEASDKKKKGAALAEIVKAGVSILKQPESTEAAQ